MLQVGECSSLCIIQEERLGSRIELLSVRATHKAAQRLLHGFVWQLADGCRRGAFRRGQRDEKREMPLNRVDGNDYFPE